MKRDQNNLMKGLGVLALLGLLAFAGIAVAEEAYDEDTYGPKAPIVWAKPVKGVVFLHKTHTMDAGLSCDACHGGGPNFEMAAGTAEQNADFTMESLYKGKYCGACHDGSTAFASNTRCTSCHVGVKGYNRLTGAAPQGKAGH
ncbi:MAG: c(7)-type cytochrome triheme domain-containing protein [Thermodesulfobacteriota bacterium]